MRVLVTGAAGMLGSDLIPYLRGRGHDVVGVDLEVDIRDPAKVDACVDEVAPDAVIHAAAWTDVDGAEANEDAAYAVNADGAGNVARAAARRTVPLVYISTDYVFDGTAGRDYTEDDPTAPIGAYGRTKRAGERAVLEAHPNGARVARTAWLYGAHGRNFVDTMRSLGAARDAVQVVADQVGSPTWTRDLAPALEAVLGLPAGTYHTAGGGSVTWAGFAEAIFAEAGIDCRVERITTAELGRPAPRPARSVLAVTRPGAPRLRHWREALRAYLQEAG
jgi:dTDP-4-dehydrorhamnose reductase